MAGLILYISEVFNKFSNLILNWGYVEAINDIVQINFPISFSGLNYVAFRCCDQSTNASSQNATKDFVCIYRNNATKMTTYTKEYKTMWFAIGY